MEKVLFVCHGNICRSPMAEMIFKQMVKETGRENEFEIASVATSTEEIGNDIYPPAKLCLKRHNISFTRRRARQMTRDDYAYYDRIFVMDRNNWSYLAWLFPDLVTRSGAAYRDKEGKIQSLMELAGKNCDVADPWYSGDFEQTYDDIVESLTSYLKNK